MSNAVIHLSCKCGWTYTGMSSAWRKSWKQLHMDSLQNLDLFCIKFMKNNTTIKPQICYLIGLTFEKDTHLIANMPFRHAGKTGLLYLPPPALFLAETREPTAPHHTLKLFQSKSLKQIFSSHIRASQKSWDSATRGLYKWGAHTLQFHVQR